MGLSKFQGPWSQQTIQLFNQLLQRTLHRNSRPTQRSKPSKKDTHTHTHMGCLLTPYVLYDVTPLVAILLCYILKKYVSSLEDNLIHVGPKYNSTSKYQSKFTRFTKLPKIVSERLHPKENQENKGTLTH